jgi:hypothetical protein
MRFADLRGRVTRQVDAVPRNDMQIKVLDCPVHAYFQPLTPDKPQQEKDKYIFPTLRFFLIDYGLDNKHC